MHATCATLPTPRDEAFLLLVPYCCWGQPGQEAHDATHDQGTMQVTLIYINSKRPSRAHFVHWNGDPRLPRPTRVLTGDCIVAQNVRCNP